MSRFLPAAALALMAFSASTTSAQTAARSQHDSFPAGAIEGRVLDDRQAPVIGAMVSVVGRITAVATTDREGRYSLKDLPFGPYILSVHSRGYWQSRGRTVQLNTAKLAAPLVQLERANAPKAQSVPPAVAPALAQLAGFGALDVLPITVAAPSASDESAPADNPEDGGETAWRLRHLPRSILKEITAEDMWVSHAQFEPRPDWFGHGNDGVGSAALFRKLALSGQVNLLTTESSDNSGQVIGANGAHNVAFVSVGTQAAGGAWAMQGAMTQGDLASWIVAGSYKSIDSGNHAYELGLTYSAQSYDGGNPAAVSDSARNAGTVYGYDQWTVSPRLVLGYGTGFARYDYLSGSGFWSPRVSVTVPFDGVRVKAVASQREVVPGAEEFAPSVAGLWLPPQHTFSSLAVDGAFRPERTRHMEIAVERDLAAGVIVSVRGFGQHVNDQLVEMFGVDPGHPETSPGHYFVGNAGDIDARGWGVGMTHEVPGYLRSTIEYTVATTYWSPSSDAAMFTGGLRPGSAPSSQNVYDLQTSVEGTIRQTSTKILAKYRINTAFWGAEAGHLSMPGASTRFNVRVNQSLPFLRFSNADWEALVDVCNMFRDADALASLYDEAFAVRAPRRIVGGLLVKF